MTRFYTIASGSSGNAALLSWGDAHLLIDMGISCQRLTKALAELGLKPGDLSAILITHEHADHIGGLATYIKKYHTPILCTPGTGYQLVYRLAGIEPLLRPVPMGESVTMGRMTISTLPTSHDCRESAAFRVDTPDGAVGYLTDTGYVLQDTGERLLGAELLVLESNHDVDMVREGPYPYALKQRVLGSQGHLSNEDAGRYAAASALAGTRTIVLAHLSDKNNTPQAALTAVRRCLESAGCTPHLVVAPKLGLSEEILLEGAVCRR